MKTSEKKIKNLVAYLTPPLIQTIMPLVTLPVFTRFLTPKDFGIIALATAYPSLIVNFLSCNMDASAQRYYFEYRKNTTQLCGLINTSSIFLLFVFVISITAIFF